MAEVTSKINKINIDTSGRGSGAAAFQKSVFTATKVTGPTGNPPKYQTEIIKYSDAKGNDPLTIGTRDGKGKLTFNDNASSTDKKGSSQIAQASTTQMNSPEVQALATTAAQKEALSGSAGQPNKAKGSGDDKSSTGADISDSNKTKPGSRNEFPGKGGTGPLVYPASLDSIDRDLIKFSMMEYRPSKMQQSGKRQEGNIIGQVLLPIPGGISDSNNVQWGSGELDPLEMAVASAALTGMQESFEKGANQFGTAVTKALEDPNTQKALGGMIIGAATGIGKQALQRGEGMVLNPNMELLFGGPTMRNFGFTFKLSPRSKKEAKNVIKILRFFKQGMAVIRSQSQYFLKAPHTFKLEYIKKTGGNQELHPYLNQFKECALNSCTVQYTPDGNYNTYSDGVMTSYSMQLGFSELEPIFNDEYPSDNDASIGY